MKAIILIFWLSVCLASCSLLESIGLNAIGVGDVKLDFNKSGKPIDSLTVSQKPTYLELDLSKIKSGKDYNLKKQYSTIWYLRTDSILRIEFTPRDTVIKIFKK
jgi:hypothetical protein